MSYFQVGPTDDLTLCLLPERQRAAVPDHQYLWLAGGYDLEVEQAIMVVIWWIVFFVQWMCTIPDMHCNVYAEALHAL